MYKPYLFEAYTASAVHFAKLLQSEHTADLHIPALIGSAETLYPEHRKFMEEVFHTHFFNRYGSREVGNVAHECEQHQGLHINEESYYVEVTNT